MEITDTASLHISRIQVYLSVVDPYSQFLGCESPEHQRVNGPYPSGGQHCNDCLGDHRHVDQDPVPPLNPILPQHTC